MSAVIHTHHLAETIGPRGSTTPQEVEAARYAASVLKSCGLEPETETFTSARSSYQPFLFFGILVLASEILFLAGRQTGAVAALAITLVVFPSVVLEATFRANPLRWFISKGRSQNVWARIPASNDSKKQLILMGHLDSHRTPLVFSSESWLKVFRAFVPAGLASTVVLIFLFAVGTISPLGLWRWLSIPFILVIIGMSLLMLQADLTAFTEGANDNATGAAVVLSLAERISQEPLKHTDLVVVLSGCEEVGCYGADDFARRHHADLRGASWVTVDSAGGRQADPAYLTSETFMTTARSDPRLLSIADQIASDRSELRAYSTSFRGAYTEGSIAVKYGFPALTLLSLRRDGVLPDWHRPTDVYENVDKDVLERCEAFIFELVHAIDRDAAAVKS